MSHPVDEVALDALRPPPPVTRAEQVRALLDAMGTSPVRVAVGAVVLAVVAGGAMWLLRPPPAPVEASLPVASSVVAPTTTTTESSEVVVHVAGAVRQPGVLTLPAGSRVVDAIDAAGGLARGADPARLNLAALLVDGERVYVPKRGEALPPPADPGRRGEAPGSTTHGPVDLNAATVEQLDELPGIGPATAQAIVDFRDRNGPFTSVDQLLDVRGIGEAKLAQLRDLVTV